MKQKQIFETFRKLIFSVFAFLLAASFAGAQRVASYPPGTELDENGVPVLIQHLPDAERAAKRAAFVTNLQDLQKLTGNRALLNEIEFVPGTEAATAVYDGARVVVVEFAAPQVSVEVDKKIADRIAQSPESAANTAYRRIGNYSVFVFDAPNEQTANILLDQVSYEKDVQWLGGNPFPGIAAKRRERQDLQTAGDIIVAVIQTAGLAVVAALGIGGLCGAAIFYNRRRQQNLDEAFSDAGGMLRLNLDDLTAQSNRLLEDGQVK